MCASGLWELKYIECSSFHYDCFVFLFLKRFALFVNKLLKLFSAVLITGKNEFHPLKKIIIFIKSRFDSMLVVRLYKSKLETTENIFTFALVVLTSSAFSFPHFSGKKLKCSLFPSKTFVNSILVLTDKSKMV
jgi:hypothetical protein